jgi:hypothetical protein
MKGNGTPDGLEPALNNLGVFSIHLESVRFKPAMSLDDKEQKLASSDHSTFLTTLQTSRVII